MHFDFHFFYYKLNLFSPDRVDDARQPMSRVVPIPSSQLTPYRVVIVLRLIILGFFLQYRVTHPVKDAYPLWLTSVICEIWFALSWILDQFPKWSPVNRETYLERLALRSEWPFYSSFVGLFHLGLTIMWLFLSLILACILLDMIVMENHHS